MTRDTLFTVLMLVTVASTIGAFSCLIAATVVSLIFPAVAVYALHFFVGTVGLFAVSFVSGSLLDKVA